MLLGWQLSLWTPKIWRALFDGSCFEYDLYDTVER
jgi:hypothetical protein